MDRLKNILLCLCCIVLSSALKAQVVINEVMSSNSTTIADEDGEFNDWIELYNAGTNEVNLLNWTLTDEPEDTFEWILPQRIIRPGEFLLIFASGKDRPGAELHTSFRLKAGVEPLYLYNANLQRVDSIPGLCIPQNVSYGWLADGGIQRVHFLGPTPGASNNGSDTMHVIQDKDTIIFSQSAGFYSKPIELTLQHMHPLGTIYYTINGSEPDEGKRLYTQPLQIKDRTEDKNDESDEKTAVTWQPPRGKVFKATAIRAASFINGCQASRIETNTYFVHPQMTKRYTFPVIALTTDEDNFFDEEEGIYVPGPAAAAEANFEQEGREWEREVHLEMFTPQGEQKLDQDAGARIHGRYTVNFPQKSLRLYARDSYGKDRFDYPFFPGKNTQSYKRILLRTPDSDHSNTLFKDELSVDIMRPLNTDFQDYAPCIVFLNGEYWGIHNIRERIDDYYLNDNSGYPVDSFDLIDYSRGIFEVKEGFLNDWLSLLDFVKGHDMAVQSNMDFVAQTLDVSQFIDYTIVNLYLANYDWPNNNVRFWRSRSPLTRYRFFNFDCDGCMVRYTLPNLKHFTELEEADRQIVALLSRFLQNEEFQRTFRNRFYHYINTVFSSSRIIKLVDSLEKLYAPMVPEHLHRWNVPESVESWQRNVDLLREFAIQRVPEMVQQLRENFEVPLTVFPNPAEEIFQVRPDMETDGPVVVEFFNMYGRLQSRAAFGSAQELRFALFKTRDFSPGVYVVRVQQGIYLHSAKLIIPARNQ